MTFTSKASLSKHRDSCHRALVHVVVRVGSLNEQRVSRCNHPLRDVAVLVVNGDHDAQRPDDFAHALKHSTVHVVVT